eukprot:169764_1
MDNNLNIAINHWKNKLNVNQLSPEYHSMIGILLLQRLISTPLDNNNKNSDDFSKSYEHLMRSVTLNDKTNNQDKDWVTLQYIADWFLLFAKQNMKLITNNKQNINLCIQALKQSIKYYKKCDKIQKQSSTLQCQDDICLQSTQNNPYKPFYKSQTEYIKPTALVLKHWGDCYLLLNKPKQAMKIFQIGVNKGIWQNKWCRPGIISQTANDISYFYEATVFEHISKLKDNLYLIRNELLSSLSASNVYNYMLYMSKNNILYLEGMENTMFYKHGWIRHTTGLSTGLFHSLTSDSSQDKKDIGGWFFVNFVVDGKMRTNVCSNKQWKNTCAIIWSLLGETESLQKVIGQIKVSLMLPNTRIRPHTGPRNDRLRLHCTLMSSPKAARIRVGPNIWKYYNDTDNMSEEKEECFVFDESCEHEVIFDGDVADAPRVVLIVDFVNPFLTDLVKDA